VFELLAGTSLSLPELPVVGLDGVHAVRLDPAAIKPAAPTPVKNSRLVIPIIILLLR
jgi:hypothetical protein